MDFRHFLPTGSGCGTHHEMRRLAVYALVQEKNGSKIKPSAMAGDEDSGNTEGSAGNWKGSGDVMAGACERLFLRCQSVGGRVVIDKTALKGKFDFTLSTSWTPDPTMGAMPFRA